MIKTTKTFLATHKTFGGTIRMVIIQEDHGPQFFYCTNIETTVREIIEAFADFSTIEQVFHDVKEVWGADQQQVRHLWSIIGCWHLNLWMFTLTELWAWPLKAKQLTHRDDSPWDTTARRPSHADKRKALQTQCLLNEYSATTAATTLPRTIKDLLQRLLRLAVKEEEMPESAGCQRPIAVAAQLVLRRLLDRSALDALFQEHAQSQSERT